MMWLTFCIFLACAVVLQTVRIHYMKLYKRAYDKKYFELFDEVERLRAKVQYAEETIKEAKEFLKREIEN